MNWSVIIGIFGTLAGFALSYLAFARNSKKDSADAGKESGTVLTQPSGSRCVPNCLLCSSWSIAGISVSETQLISSRNKMPVGTPVFSILS